MHGELVVLAVLGALGGFLLLADRTQGPVPDPAPRAARRSAFVPGVPRRRARPGGRARGLPAAAAVPAPRSSPRCGTCAPTCGRSGCSPSGWCVATTVAVAVVAHAVIEDLPWAAAFVLGAIVSPTDPVAATEIARALGAPRRLVTIVEGEAWSTTRPALIAYKFAVAAVADGHVLAGRRDRRVRRSARVAGVAIGLAVGALVAELRRAHRRRADGDRGLAADAVLRLPAGRGARRRRPCSPRSRAALPRLALARAGHAGDAHPGLRVLGDPDLRPQRRAVRARRAAAAGGHRRISDGYAPAELALLRRGRRAPGDRGALRVGLPARPTCRAGSRAASASAIPLAADGDAVLDRVDRDARRGLAGRRAGDPAQTEAATRSRAAT